MSTTEAGARASAVQPHDLIRLDPPWQLCDEAERPFWVDASLQRAPWVVVRRLAAPADLIAVGVRGATREQRHASWLPAAAVATKVTPEELACRRDWRRDPAIEFVPALRALDAAAGVLAAAGLRWGPVGSVGFGLASGVLAATTASDLDLVIRMHRLPSQQSAHRLLASLAECVPKLDVLLETDAGAISLAEYTSTASALLLRTPHGPRLIDRASLVVQSDVA